jgi:hypothetical protein
MGMSFLWWAKTGHKSQPISPFQSSIPIHSTLVVACAVGPSVNTFFYFFTFSKFNNVKQTHLRNQLIFTFQTQFFAKKEKKK